MGWKKRIAREKNRREKKQNRLIPTYYAHISFCIHPGFGGVATVSDQHRLQWVTNLLFNTWLYTHVHVDLEMNHEERLQHSRRRQLCRQQRDRKGRRKTRETELAV